MMLAQEMVLRILDRELLSSAETLRSLLAGKDMDHFASDAVMRMGSAGMVFYSALLSKIQVQYADEIHEKALGSALRYAADKVPEVLNLTSSNDEGIRYRAAAGQ